MVGVKYISYLTPTMSDNIISVSLCFAWHSAILLCSYHEHEHENLILD